MGSSTPHYTDWGVGPDLAGFQQPGVNMSQWAAYNTPIQLPFGYSGGGYFPHKKRFAKSYGGGDTILHAKFLDTDRLQRIKNIRMW